MIGKEETVTEPRHSAALGLVHDLRTPLNQIIGYSEMLAEQAKEAGLDSFVEDLQKVRTAGKQLLTVVNDNFCPVLEADPNQETPTLDAYDVEARILAEEAGVVELEIGLSKGSLLVVDDIEANRDVLMRRLKRQGYIVAAAENGREALDMLAKGAFDVVLLDIMMPIMDGYEVLRRLKADQRLKHIPVIMISALSELDSVALCIEMGADDYLTKPFNPTLLAARIGSSLGKKMAHDRESDLFEELQQQYAKLQALELQRDSLTHMIVHDLRTPLTSVIAGMLTLNVVGPLSTVQREVMDISVSGARALLAMINDLLDVEKIEAGAMKLDYAEFAVADIVDAAIAQVTALAEEKRINLVRKVSTGLGLLCCDEAKICRTLVNLLGNAVKVTPIGGTITIDAEFSQDGGSMVFSVSDTGKGIPEEAFDRIFEKFGQVATRQGERNVGTGLGLSFCKLAVEAHGGGIHVESKLGVGSNFWFTVPLIPQ